MDIPLKEPREVVPSIHSVFRATLPYLAYAYMTLVGWTSRVRWFGQEHLQELARLNSNFIYAFWHNRQVLFTYTHRGTHVTVLVSRSQDGELIARTMELSRLNAVRGSSSRAALAATRELLAIAANGHVLGISPDGPKGPACRIKPGVMFLALKSGLPIVPITNASSRKLVFKKSWDRFQVPLPFSRTVVVMGPPLWVRTPQELEAKTKELQESLERITARAEQLVGD